MGPKRDVSVHEPAILIGAVPSSGRALSLEEIRFNMQLPSRVLGAWESTTTGFRLGVVFAGCLMVAAGIGGCNSKEPSTATMMRSLETVTVVVDEGFESAHPYANNTRQEWMLDVPGNATSVTVHFGRVETEPFFDYISILDHSGQEAHRMSGHRSNESFTVEGPVLIVRFFSDHSITYWGFEVLGYEYEIPASSDYPPAERRPYCGAVGTRGEGWYWADTGELIKYAACADSPEPVCGAICSRSEGWYTDVDEGFDGLIVWDFCRFVVGISVHEEPCGADSGFECYEGFGLYCAGETDSEPGLCLRHGRCLTAEDCYHPENAWIRPACVGFATCSEENTCVWECETSGLDLGDVWSWTTVAVRDVESDHPYANDFFHTWTITKPGASEIRAHFSRIDVERGFDWIAVYGEHCDEALYLTGGHHDYWTPAIEGDTVHITLITDHSITRWGFEVDAVAYHELLPAGACNRDEDCGFGNICVPGDCDDPYAPCYGECRRDDSCDDGLPITCRMMPPVCDEGLILAHQDSCYRCVDPETCEPPELPGSEGWECRDDGDCSNGLRCKNVIDGVGSCRSELWCAPETVAVDCADLFHPAIPGYWDCPAGTCTWQGAATSVRAVAEDTPMSIPDNDAAGIESIIEIEELLPGCSAEVFMDLRITHSYIGDLVVSLSDPHGTRVILLNRQGGSQSGIDLSRINLTGHVGQAGGNGTWRLHVSDRAWLDTGTLDFWALNLTCR